MRRIVAALLTCFVALASGQTPGRQSSKTIRISGRVVDLAGQGVAGQSVTLWDAASGEIIADAHTAQGDGAFAFSAVPPGTYELHIYKSGPGDKVQTVKAIRRRDIDLGTIVMPILLPHDPVVAEPNRIRSLNELTTEALETTVCELLKDPLRFRQKLVRVRAEAYWDSLDEPPWVFDLDCRGVIFLNLPTSGSIVNDWTYRRFAQVLPQGIPITATVEGKFEYFLMIGEPNRNELSVTNLPDFFDPAPPAAKGPQKRR